MQKYLMNMKGRLVRVPVDLNYVYYMYETASRKWKITKVKYKARHQSPYEYWECSIYDNRFKCNEGGTLPGECKSLDDAIEYIDDWEKYNE